VMFLVAGVAMGMSKSNSMMRLMHTDQSLIFGQCLFLAISSSGQWDNHANARSSWCVFL
jgi:hypothetical protein